MRIKRLFHLAGIFLLLGMAAGCTGLQTRSLVIPPQGSWHIEASSTAEGRDVYAILNSDAAQFWQAETVAPAWLQVDLGQAAIISGFSLIWGNAFATEYSVRLSRDGATWHTVFQTQQGDGAWDRISFDPTLARYIRWEIRRVEAGTPVEILSIALQGLADQLRITASDGLRPPTPGILSDGDNTTFWHCPLPAASLTFDFHRAYTFGSTRVDWGAAGGAGRIAQYVSSDGETWRLISEIVASGAAFDTLLYAPEDTRHLRLVFTEAGEEGFDVADIRFRGLEGAAQTWQEYAIATEQAPAGLYPDMFARRQTYWTLSARAGRERGAALLDEWGVFAPSAIAPTLTPLLVLDGEILTARQAQTRTYALAEDVYPLPSVSWRFTNGLTVTVRALTLPEENAPSALQVDVANNGTHTLRPRLVFLLRPLRLPPQWAGGGFASIETLRLEPRNDVPWQTAIVNELPQYAIAATEREFSWAAVPFERGDVARCFLGGRMPPTDNPAAQDTENGLASGAWWKELSLSPGKTNRTVILARSTFGPRQTTRRTRTESPEILSLTNWTKSPRQIANAFDSEWQKAVAEWKALLAQPAIQVGRMESIQALQTQTAILLSRPARQHGLPGFGWHMANSAMTVAALLRSGHTEEARALVEEIAAAIPDNGALPARLRPPVRQAGTGLPVFGARPRRAAAIQQETDLPAPYGQFAFMLMEVYRYTQDLAFLETHYPALLRTLNQLNTIRILPKSAPESRFARRWLRIKHFFRAPTPPPQLPYAQNVWALLAWKEARAAALALGLPEDAQRAEDHYQSLRTGTQQRIQKQLAGLPLDSPLPRAPNDPAFDDAALALLFFPAAEHRLIPENTFQRSLYEYYNAFLSTHRPGNTTWIRTDAADLILPLAAVGRGDYAREILRQLLALRRPAAWHTWPSLAAVSSRSSRNPSRAMRMPSPETAAAYTIATLGLIARDDEGTLHILCGTPPEWLQENGGLTATGLATPYGKLDLTAYWRGDRLTIEVGGTATPPGGFRIHWPLEGRPDRVHAGRRPLRQYDERGCTLDGHFRGRLEVYLPYHAPWPRDD